MAASIHIISIHFDNMLGIHFHDIKLKRGKSFIESPKWLADKKSQ